MKLDQVRRLALALPETLEQPHFESTSFRVHGKIFATAPPDGTRLHVFVDEETRETALALEPDFLEKLFWGKRVCGLRVLLENAKPRVVASLLTQAWRAKAPRRLLSASDAVPASEVATPPKRRARVSTTDTPPRNRPKAAGARRAG